ncbi:MAG TPA: hypothetical protein VNR37_09465 [Microbacteriaceae bacterium]|nr:hypothetical protein [Microbacteriaceae bacterium]
MSFSVGRFSEDPLSAAIERALEDADLRGGDSLGGTSGIVVIDVDPAAVETGDVGAAIASDGDGDGD